MGGFHAAILVPCLNISDIHWWAISTDCEQHSETFDLFFSTLGIWFQFMLWLSVIYCEASGSCQNFYYASGPVNFPLWLSSLHSVATGLYWLELNLHL